MRSSTSFMAVEKNGGRHDVLRPQGRTISRPSPPGSMRSTMSASKALRSAQGPGLPQNPRANGLMAALRQALSEHGTPARIVLDDENFHSQRIAPVVSSAGLKGIKTVTGGTQQRSLYRPCHESWAWSGRQAPIRHTGIRFYLLRNHVSRRDRQMSWKRWTSVRQRSWDSCNIVWLPGIAPQVSAAGAVCRGQDNRSDFLASARRASTFVHAPLLRLAWPGRRQRCRYWPLAAPQEAPGSRALFSGRPLPLLPGHGPGPAPGKLGRQAGFRTCGPGA